MDFVIDLDDVWKWVGFSNKAHSKHLLEKQFIIDKDYKLLLTKPSEQKMHLKGGHNKETFMLNVATFKKFCLKAGTKKADEIHDYYIKLEETLQEVVHNESTELKLQLEKTNMELEKRRRTITLKNKKYIELLNANELSFPTLDKTIKEIIMSVECNIVNYMKLLEENKRLKKQLETHDEMNNINELVLLRAENKHLKMDNLKLQKGNKQALCEPVVTSATVSETEVENYGIVMQSLKKHNHTKCKDGMYHIGGNVFEILRSTRADVWNGKAYQTTGGVPKSGLMINNTGKIVSKIKSIQGHKNNKFEMQ